MKHQNPKIFYISIKEKISKPKTIRQESKEVNFMSDSSRTQDLVVLNIFEVLRRKSVSLTFYPRP